MDDAPAKGAQRAPNRFRYAEKRFGHAFFERVSLNQRQLGHKKYRPWTDKDDRLPPARLSVHLLPRRHADLASRAPPRGNAARCVALAVAVVIGSTVAARCLPGAQPELLPVEGAAESVARALASLKKSLNRPYNVEPMIVRDIIALGFLLNEDRVVRPLMDAARDTGFFEALWGFLRAKARHCESPAAPELITIGLNFMRDFALAANDTYVNPEVAGYIFGKCYEITNLTAVWSQLLIIAARNERAESSLDGIATPIVNAILNEDFGPWTLHAWRFFAVWANFRTLKENDLERVCKFMRFALDHIDSWKRDHDEAMCVLATGVDCECTNTSEFQTIYTKRGCTEIARRVLGELKNRKKVYERI
jgi:hypothetical protein